MGRVGECRSRVVGERKNGYDRNNLPLRLEFDEGFLLLNQIMQSQKFSISLPLEMVKFIEHYKNETGCSSRSQVISEALHLLQLRELEQAYQEASLETDQAWETTVGDGLSHETW